MKKARRAKPKRKNPAPVGEMRPEYHFDYTKSRPNRFAAKMAGGVVAVVLEPDVAAVFHSAEAVNALLRSVIAAFPVGAKR